MGSQAAREGTDVAQAERRRGQRIHLEQGLDVAWHLGDGTYVSAQAQTEDVSAHGARLLVDRELPVRTVIAMKHPRRDDWTLARVIRCGTCDHGWTPTAVELAVPNESFWGAVSWSGM